jgi:hypothetical protein
MEQMELMLVELSQGTSREIQDDHFKFWDSPSTPVPDNEGDFSCHTSQMP